MNDEIEVPMGRAGMVRIPADSELAKRWLAEEAAKAASTDATPADENQGDK